MKLGYFTMPLHPPERPWRGTLREDREAILLCDRLGYSEAYVGEHATDAAETITSCVAFRREATPRALPNRVRGWRTYSGWAHGRRTLAEPEWWRISVFGQGNTNAAPRSGCGIRVGDA